MTDIAGRWARGLDGERAFNGQAATEFISIPEWARRLGVSADSAYKAARLGQIPGCFAIGRLYRVNWPVFVRRAGGDEATGEEAPGDAVGEASRLPR